MVNGQSSKPSGDNPEEGGLAVIRIPTDKTQAVIDFIADMDGDQDDVSGHMMALGGTAARQYTMTRCSSQSSGLFQIDWNCGDNDINET
jgi:hypothetical protein